MNAEQNQRTEEREIYRRACVRAYRFGVAWSTAARTTIERYREALNELNGFPVPDKDTGSNIAHTLLTLTEEFERGMERVLPTEALPSEKDAGAPDGKPGAGAAGTSEESGVSEAAGTSEEESLVHLWVQLGDIYEHAIMRASRVARGNSGTLLCAWALEAVRSYWFLPGNLAQELGEAADELPLVRALEAAYEAVIAGGSLPKHREVKLEYAHAEARAMAFAAERIRASVGEQMVPSTMLSVMVELARLDAHYEADADAADEVLKERRRALMCAALERTADFPPSPELAGFVDAGALGFYLAVVHSNPRWEGATLSETQVESMLRAPSAAGSVARAASAAGSEPAEHAESEGESGWELMGTLTCEPLALAQLRPELETMGDSLLITPLDMAAGLWALHVHVPEIEPARELIMGYGQWTDERISSLADGHHADHACCAEGGA